MHEVGHDQRALIIDRPRRHKRIITDSVIGQDDFNQRQDEQPTPDNTKEFIGAGEVNHLDLRHSFLLPRS